MPPLHFTKEWIKPKCFNKKEKLFEAFESTSSKKIGLVAKSNQFSQKGWNIVSEESDGAAKEFEQQKS